VRHIQVVAGNRSAIRAGTMFRIEPAMVGDLAEPVTRAVMLGASDKDMDELFAPSAKAASKSGQAAELILDMLEAAPGLEMESDALDALVAGELSLAARTTRDIRIGLNRDGLTRSVPDKDEAGEVVRWMVRRTGAPRP
jgi:hypothetical protein